MSEIDYGPVADPSHRAYSVMRGAAHRLGFKTSLNSRNDIRVSTKTGRTVVIVVVSTGMDGCGPPQPMCYRAISGSASGDDIYHAMNEALVAAGILEAAEDRPCSDLSECIARPAPCGQCER